MYYNVNDFPYFELYCLICFFQLISICNAIFPLSVCFEFYGFIGQRFPLFWILLLFIVMPTGKSIVIFWVWTGFFSTDCYLLIIIFLTDINCMNISFSINVSFSVNVSYVKYYIRNPLEEELIGFNFILTPLFVVFHFKFKVCINSDKKPKIKPPPLMYLLWSLVNHRQSKGEWILIGKIFWFEKPNF